MLAKRIICDDPSIVRWPQEELLSLDNMTTQWASAAALCGDPHRLANPPVKVALSYEAVSAMQNGDPSPIRPDVTIRAQAVAFLAMMRDGVSAFEPTHSEDFCFATAFDYVTLEEGRKRWPSIVGHESKRHEEMFDQKRLLTTKGQIDSTDHRVIQSLAMFAELSGIKYAVSHPKAVAKSWPLFWEFLDADRNGVVASTACA